MSALGNLVGDIGAATGDKGSYSQQQFTRSPGIQSALNDLIGSYKSQTSKDSTNLNDFIRKYLSTTPQATTWAGQEENAINRFYNGDVESQLKDLENQQRTLGNESVAQALAYARGNQNRSQMAGGAGNSSYLNRQALGVGADVNLQNATNLLGQQRADVQYLNTMPISLAGQRTNIANTLANRALVPTQAAESMLGFDASTLAGLAGINNANNQYGIQYNPSGWETAGNIVGDVGNIAMDAASLYATGGVAGQFGSPSSNQMKGLQFGAGPVAPSYVPPTLNTNDLATNYMMGNYMLGSPQLTSWGFN